MNQLFLLFSILIPLLFTNCIDTKIREKYDYNEIRKSSAETFVKLSDGWTHYELSGPDSGTVAVLIHGGTIPMCIWDPQVEAFTTAGIKILRYDQYGKGLSERPEIIYNRSLFKRQLSELLDSLSIDQPVDLLGPSFGATIAIEFAAAHPKRVRSIILTSPTLNLLESDSPLASSIKMIRIPLFGKILISTLARSKIIKRGLELVPTDYSSCDSTFLQQFQIKGTAKCLLSVFRSDAYGNYLTSAAIVEKNNHSILLIHGENDKDVTPAMIKETRKYLPSCKYIKLTDAGHSPGTESQSADRLNRIYIDFLTNDR